MDQTPRQRLMEMLRAGPASFEALCFALQLRHGQLEAELRHVERSARAAGERLLVTPAECEACGFVFRARGSKHFHPPGRCPQCKSERIADPTFQLGAAGAADRSPPPR